jgi:hypothetical protein
MVVVVIERAWVGCFSVRCGVKGVFEGYELYGLWFLK